MQKLKVSFHFFFMILLILSGLTGCGYFMSGEWQDDPKNWERAFHQKAPKEIEVIHSYYWRSPHWTYEAAYYFALRGSREAHDLFFANDQLKKLENKSDSNIQADDFFHGKPLWFLPKALMEYEIWIFKDEPYQHFRLFIDKSSGDIFVTDYQV